MDLTGTQNVDPNASSGPTLNATIQEVIKYIRACLRDYPELNRLVAGEESSDRQIAIAIVKTISDFNTSPPLLNPVTLETYPSLDLLVDGTIINLFESIGFLQTRNNISYSDGQGVGVSVNDKAPLLMQWIDRLSRKYETKKMQLKVSLNIEGAMVGAGIHSELYIRNSLGLY